MSFFSIPDCILEQNIQTVRSDLVKMMDNDDANFQQTYSNSQNMIRPILGRKYSLPLPETYSRKMSADSVSSDGLLAFKTTLLPERSSYFDEIRVKGDTKRFSRRNSFNYSQRGRCHRPGEMTLQSLNITVKSYPRPTEKTLQQRLKIMEESLLNFVNLSRSLSSLYPLEFYPVDKDIEVNNELGEDLFYLIKLAINEIYWVSSVATALNLRDKFLESFCFLRQESYQAIIDAQKSAESTRFDEESHDLNESIDAINYWIRQLYTFLWLTLRLSGKMCQVQERNLFIGV